MSYVALYRKYRPSDFDSVKGQEHVTKTLKHQVKTGRLQHAYLFCGTRGTGKTSAAKILAKAVNCENPADGNPCGVCESCREIASGKSMNVIEIDAASNNGVDSVREIVEEVRYRPASGRYKVYIIDEVHMMSPGAFSALLKTLEEPPEYVIFILATTESGRIPVTILSRCQRYDFRRISTAQIAQRMRELSDKEGIKADDGALDFIASAAKGSMRDALSILDRCIAFHADEPLTYAGVLKTLGAADSSVFSRITEELLNGSAAAAVRIMGKETAAGLETGQFVESYIAYLEKLLIISVTAGSDASSLTEIPEERMYEWQNICSMTDPDTIMRFIRVLSELQGRIRFSSNARVLTEITLIQLCCPQSDSHEDAIPGRISRLEKILEGGFLPASSPEQAEGSRKEEKAEEEESFVLPDAAPEDLKMICSDWRQLVSAMPEGPVRTQLKADAVPQYNAETLENKLYIELRSTLYSGPMNKVLAEHDDYREEIERFIEKRYGKHVDVEIHLKEHRAENLRTVDVDRQLEEFGIEFEVEDMNGAL